MEKKVFNLPKRITKMRVATLPPHALKYLTERLSVEAADAAGLYWMPFSQAAMLHKLPKLAFPGDPPAIVVPYPGGYARVYIVKPDGRAEKLAPEAVDYSTRSRPYTIDDYTGVTRLYFDESDLRAILHAVNFDDFVIGLNGANAFFDSKFGSGEAHEETLAVLREPTLKEVVFRLDSDIERNGQVSGAFKKAAWYLQTKFPKLRVGYIRYPHGKDGKKQGSDDLFHALGPDRYKDFYLDNPVWYRAPTTSEPSAPLDLAALRNTTAVKVEMYVDPIIPAVGLTLLIGGPKRGKSWLAMLLCFAALTKQKFLGLEPAPTKKVLYIAVDDPSPVRFAQRLNAFDPEQKITLANLDVRVEWPKGDDCLVALRLYFETNPVANLIVLDAYLALRASRSKRHFDLLEEDYEFIKQLQVLSHTYRRTVLLLVHTRKQGRVNSVPDNPFDEIQTSGAVPAAADTLIALFRVPQVSSNGLHLGLLFGTGRDVEEWDMGIEIRASRWERVGSAQDAVNAPQRTAILAILREEPTKLWPAPEVAERLGKQTTTVRMLMSRMARDGQLVAVRGREGGYRLVVPKGGKF